MADVLSAAVLGVVEGVTEFLPVSSTGHLIVAADLLRVRDANGVFEIAIQFGAVLAVLWHYRRDLLGQARSLSSDRGARRLWLGVAVAFLPAALLGLALSDWITAHLFNPTSVAAALIVGGVALLLIERRAPAPRTHALENVTLRQALGVGAAQCLALVPGMSRSASSIIGGLLSGLDRPTATAFSFYLSIPTLGAATGYALLKSGRDLAGADLAGLAVGTLVAFLTALLAIGWLLRYIARHDFRGFAVYRIVAGLLILAYFGWRGSGA